MKNLDRFYSIGSNFVPESAPSYQANRFENITCGKFSCRINGGEDVEGFVRGPLLSRLPFHKIPFATGA